MNDAQREWLEGDVPSGASGNVCRVDERAESRVVGVAVAPSDVAADQSGLGGVVGVVGASEREVAQRPELGFDASWLSTSVPLAA